MTVQDGILIGKKILVGALLTVIPFLIYYFGLWAVAQLA